MATRERPSKGEGCNSGHVDRRPRGARARDGAYRGRDERDGRRATRLARHIDPGARWHRPAGGDARRGARGKAFEAWSAAVRELPAGPFHEGRAHEVVVVERSSVRRRPRELRPLRTAAIGLGSSRAAEGPANRRPFRRAGGSSWPRETRAADRHRDARVHRRRGIDEAARELGPSPTGPRSRSTAGCCEGRSAAAAASRSTRRGTRSSTRSPTPATPPRPPARRARRSARARSTSHRSTRASRT